jgi:hypothetical protein
METISRIANKHSTLDSHVKTPFVPLQLWINEVVLLLLLLLL